MDRYCPDCGEELVERTNNSDGEKFLGCSSYPECEYTEDIEDDDDRFNFQDRRSDIKTEKRLIP